MAQCGAFDSLFCPEGMVFVHNECRGGGGGGGFCSFQVMSRRGWFRMKLIPALLLQALVNPISHSEFFRMAIQSKAV